MANVEREKSFTDIINNGTMSVDEVVASDVPPRYLFFQFLSKIVVYNIQCAFERVVKNSVSWPVHFFI